MQRGGTTKRMPAREATRAFGLMIDTARAEPVPIEQRGRGVVVVTSFEEYGKFSVQFGRVAKAKIWGQRGGVQR